MSLIKLSAFGMPGSHVEAVKKMLAQGNPIRPTIAKTVAELAPVKKIVEKPLITKLAIEGGLRTDLPNAWFNSKKLGQRSDIPLAKGLPK